MDEKPSVAVVRCSTYNEQKIEESIKRVFELSPLPDIEGKRILLKPNILSDSKPEKAVTTHPEIVKQTILYLKNRVPGQSTSEILRGFLNPGSLQKTGIYDVIRETGAVWADFSRGKISVVSPSGVIHKEFKVTSFVGEVDMIISLPKLKTHQLMYFTGAVKNLFGLVPGLAKSAYHVHYPDRDDFAEMLLDLIEAVKPSYALMDGVIGMEGPGPGNGTPHPVKVILGSRNLPALDTAASAIIGYDPMAVPTNRLALKRISE